jgi:hypothetical protein
LPQALGTGFFFKKNRKTVFADVPCQERSAQGFFRKKENSLCRRPMAWALGTTFSKKYKKPPLCRWPDREAVGKQDFKKPST